MVKQYNFNAGPSILPQEVIKQTAEAVLNFEGHGLSILEISHRAKYFQPVVDEAEALMKELLGVPEGYRVIFLGGGASLQFCMLPYNLLEKKAAYQVFGPRKHSKRPRASVKQWKWPAVPIRTTRSSPRTTRFRKTLITCILPPTTPSTERS